MFSQDLLLASNFVDSTDKVGANLVCVPRYMLAGHRASRRKVSGNLKVSGNPPKIDAKSSFPGFITWKRDSLVFQSSISLIMTPRTHTQRLL